MKEVMKLELTNRAIKSRYFLVTLLFLFLFSLQSCNKNEREAIIPTEPNTDTPINNSQKVSIKVGYEEVVDASSGTKIYIEELSDNFKFGWSGNESITLATSTSTNSSQFEMSDIDQDGYAIFTGTLPSAGSVSVTNYMAMNSEVFVSSGSNNVVGEIKAEQDYNPTSSASYALVVSQSEDTAPGTLDQPIFFKTMNSFIRFSLTKGSPAPSASHTYPKMYLRGLVLEAIGGEPLGGKFSISKSSSEFYNSYLSVTEPTSTITFNCMTSTSPYGVELGSDAMNFYIATAFGSYSSGFRITAYVANEDGEEGKMTKTFGTAGISLERNKLYKTPTLAVSPSDVVYEYEMLTNVGDVKEGQYYLAGYLGVGDLYEVWTGALSSGHDMVTSQYTYYPENKQLSGGSGAQLITLLKNSNNEFILKTSDEKYLYISNYGSSRTLALADSESGAHAVNFTLHNTGGFVLTISSGSDISYLVTNKQATSNPVRNYKSSTSGTYGVVLFKKVGGYGYSTDDSGESGGGGGGGENPSVAYGYLELPEIPSNLGSKKLYTFYAEMNGVKNVRNYSALYDPTYYAQMWTAYPLHSSHTGSLSRPSSWTSNPLIATSLQTVLTKSYGVNISTTNYSSNLYSRGHQIPNADRNGVKEMQLQTFIWTNSTPQIQNGFNGSIWGRIEDVVRSAATSYSDTIYVVTGPVFQTVGGSEDVDYIINQNDSESVAVPNYYYKIVLKVKKNSSGEITSASSVGFWLAHTDYGNNKNYETFIKSTAEIEQLTGFTFFVNLPDAVTTAAKANTSWSAFTSFN